MAQFGSQHCIPISVANPLIPRSLSETNDYSIADTTFQGGMDSADSLESLDSC